MKPGRQEPSMSMVRRLAVQAPDHLVGEVARLRQERDDLRAALSMKLSEHVRTLDLKAHHVLIVKKPGQMGREEASAILENLTERLRSRYGWEGIIVLQDSVVLGELSDTDASALYEILKARFEGGM